MQYDMHYYGTYTMAVTAGIPAEDAEVIATAAQFVDDQNAPTWIYSKSLEGVHAIASAHHPVEAGVRAAAKDVNADDSRLVWVPFHFLPGNKGNSFQERMVTQQDSEVVNAMLDYYLSSSALQAHRSHALHLMGIAAHVYADTFSHYGFLGIPSERNLVHTDSIKIDDTHSPTILTYIKEQRDRFNAHWAQTPHLGHGGVLTHPDRPYLKWSFVYKDGTESRRHNPQTFLAGCKALHNRFMQFGMEYYGASFRLGSTWDQLQTQVTKILEKEGQGDERARYWIDAIKEGAFGPVQPCSDYDFTRWTNEIDRCRESDYAADFLESHCYKFFAAADYHRGYVLKRLLPMFGLMVA